MPYEYRVVPAPKKGEKAKGIKTPDARMALAMQNTLNTMASEGWDYVRADMMPLEERSGITSKSISYQTVLVFRRAIEASEGDVATADFGAFPEDPEEIAQAEADAQERHAPRAPEVSTEDAPAAATERVLGGVTRAEAGEPT